MMSNVVNVIGAPCRLKEKKKEKKKKRGSGLTGIACGMGEAFALHQNASWCSKTSVQFGE